MNGDAFGNHTTAIFRRISKPNVLDPFYKSGNSKPYQFYNLEHDIRTCLYRGVYNRCIFKTYGVFFPFAVILGSSYLTSTPCK